MHRLLFLALGARSYHAIDVFDLAGGEDSLGEPDEQDPTGTDKA